MTWLSAAEAVRPRGEAFLDGAFVPAASGETFADTSPRDGRRIAATDRSPSSTRSRGMRSLSARKPCSRRATASSARAAGERSSARDA